MKNKLFSPFMRLFINRELILELSRRDISDRYKGQPMGVLLGIYSSVGYDFYLHFSVCSGIQNKKLTQLWLCHSLFSSYILSGMVPWLCFQTAVVSGAASIISNGSFIRQVIFPVEVFPAK